MGPATVERQGRTPNRTFVYLLAVALPLAAAAVTERIAVLHSLPFALHFIAMAIVATLGGFPPALLSVAISVAAHFGLSPESHLPAASWLVEVLRPLALLISAAVISLMTRGRRRASEALHFALAKLQEQNVALSESQQASKCASWTYDSRDITRWYPGGFEVFGIPFAELERLPSPIDLILPEDQPGVRAAVQEMLATRGPLRVEYRVLWPNGELHWSEARGNPIEGDPHLWRGVTFDITERKLAEAALIRSEKLAAMGRLASTIAHEINNPLESVTNLLYIARADASLEPVTDNHLALAERELARIGNITRLALGFVRTSPQRQVIEVIDGVEDVLSIFRHRFEMKNVIVERRYQPGVRIDIAPQELRQIVTNLISNAVDAISGPDARVSIHIGREADLSVLLVEDNGNGISEGHLSRIFDPFFTTKEDTGTGIGLWVTRELVEKNGGSISVRSGDLPGDIKTSFRIVFPVPVSSASQASAEKQRAAVS